MLSGCCVNSGATGSGLLPVKIVGTAVFVNPDWVVWFRYQVASPANRARFGKRTASMAPSASMIDAVGSSSRTIRTTGAAVPLLAAAAKSAPDTTSLDGDANRNTRSANTGSTAKNSLQRRKAAERTVRTHAATAAAADRPRARGRTTPDRTCTAASPTNAPIDAPWTTMRHRGATIPATSADPPDHERRDEHDGEPEEHEVEPLGIAEHEGLGALAERVEDRLGDRHPRDADQRREPSELDAEARSARRSRTTLLERAGLDAGQAAEPRRARERPSLRARSVTNGS